MQTCPSSSVSVVAAAAAATLRGGRRANLRNASVTFHMKLIKQKYLSIIKLRALFIENSTQHTMSLSCNNFYFVSIFDNL